MIVNSLFYVFSTILVLSSNMVINVKNSMFSVLYLVLSFISASVLLFIFECEFLALIFIIVYVGAIAVLFLFVVMMLDVKTYNENKDPVKYFPIIVFLGAIFFFEVLSDISQCFLNDSSINYTNFYFDWYNNVDSLTGIETLGQIIYTHNTLQFLMSGFVLFLAVIGSVLITVDFSIKNTSR